MDKFESLLLRYFEYLDEKGPGYNAVVGFLWLIAITILDLLSPIEFKHAYFYILPIAFVTWFSGIKAGVVISLVTTPLSSIHYIHDSHQLITSWNILTSLIFFLSIAFVMNKTRVLWEREKNLSRTDPLTGVKNLRAFSELVEHEILRFGRDKSPFSLAYLDLDNFKEVNDNHGHAAGDALLTSLVKCIVKSLRKTDEVGRLGGDEFAIFFPDTDQAAVQIVMNKVRHELASLMEKSPAPTTFSVGVVTCRDSVQNFNVLLGIADSLMYEVKHTGKNDIHYSLYPPFAP